MMNNLKSSMLHSTPSDWSRFSVVFAARTSPMNALSVISRCSDELSSPVSFRIDWISAIRSACANCRHETLTHITRGASFPNRLRHTTIWWHDSLRTRRPMSTSIPVSSATGMNSTGLTSPRVG